MAIKWTNVRGNCLLGSTVCYDGMVCEHAGIDDLLIDLVCVE